MTITFKQLIAPFPAERLEAISKVLADTSEGLTGSEIDHLLRNCNIPNPLAHTPKTEWDMTEQDALDILTMISLVHRKLDHAYRLR